MARGRLSNLRDVQIKTERKAVNEKVRFMRYCWSVIKSGVQSKKISLAQKVITKYFLFLFILMINIILI